MLFLSFFQSPKIHQEGNYSVYLIYLYSHPVKSNPGGCTGIALEYSVINSSGDSAFQTNGLTCSETRFIVYGFGTSNSKPPSCRENHSITCIYTCAHPLTYHLCAQQINGTTELVLYRFTLSIYEDSVTEMFP